VDRNFLQWGADFVSAALAAHAAEPVTYRRYAGAGMGPSFTFPGVPAWVGPVRKLTVQPGEVANADVAAGYLTFFVRAADFPARLKDAGQDYPCPKEGDWVVRTVAGRRFTYEVKPPPFGTDPAWRFADPAQAVFRIHALLYAVEDKWPSR
jgi:hypothetical protein